MILFRGDTRKKGNKLTIEGNVDYQKNKAGFFFFADNKEEAIDYATSSMNDGIRKNYNNPNITEVEVKNANILDFTKIGLLFNANKMFDFLNQHIFGNKITFNDYLDLNNLSELKNKKELNPMEKWDYNNLKNQFDNLINKVDLNFNITQVQLSNANYGIIFKSLLLKNGYDGYKFEDNSGKGYHYGFVNSNKIQIIKKYEI